MKSKLWALVAIVILISNIATAQQQSIDAVSVYERTTDLISKNFYDQTFRGLNWEKLVRESRKKIKPHSSDQHLKHVLNQLLDKLHASHTEFLSSSDQEYWALESVFSGDIDGGELTQIGAWFVSVHHRWFVRDVLEASPAAKSGLLPGDEVISVNGQALEPVKSFDQTARTYSMIIRRTRNLRSTKTILLAPVTESFQRSMLTATMASYKIYRVCGKKIGYVHLWAGTNDESLNALAAVASKAANETDSLVLDLRNGFGGAYPAYLNPFFDHDDTGKATPQIYSKPMVGIINDGVRSGKEWVADILKQTHRATLIGTRTKGYFLAGKIFPVVPGRFDLYLAVAKGVGPDLENNGVKPDIEVPFDLPFSGGSDPQLSRSLSFLCGSNSRPTN